MKSGNINQFAHLSQFNSLKDFNNNIEQWMLDVKSQLTKSELIALKRLTRYCCSVFGVCNAKISTMVSATHERGMGISRSTFERMLRKVKSLGMITVYNTFSKGNQRHNVYVFNPYTSNVEESNTNEVPQTIDVAKETVNPSKTSDNINKRNNEHLGKKYAATNIPKEFVELVGCFYDDYKVIEELYKCVSFSTRCLSYYTRQDRITLACNAFKQLVRHIKQGKRVKNIYGYFYGILNKLLDIEYQELINAIA
ncbi:hypothetical protein ACQKJC_11625 [Priestia koreensis]|uniref:hypothetical protein n=1 Tax=Priestia koreensis TaxID=284581 RepID=UPI003D03AAF1